MDAKELEATRALQRAIPSLVGQINSGQPWLTPDAERLDRLILSEWAAQQTNLPLARLPLDWLCRVGGSGGFEPWEAAIRIWPGPKRSHRKPRPPQTEVMATVVAEGLEPLQAQGVILAVPPAQRQAIRFEPPLPPAHQALLQRTAMGGMTKILTRHSRPFWREQELNGLGTGEQPWLDLTTDSGPPVITRPCWQALWPASGPSPWPHCRRRNGEC